MKKLLIILPVILLLAAACEKKPVQPKNNQPSTQQEGEQQTKKPDQTADWKIYTNTQYGFEFKHPADYQIKEGELAGRALSYFIPPQTYFLESGTEVVTVAMPKGTFPATNLEGAFMAVNVGKNLTLVGCQQYNAKSPEEKFMTKIIAVNGIEFFQAEDSGVATGHMSVDRIYHTFYNNTCFEIVLGVRTSSAMVPDLAKEVDQNQVFAKLEQILNTFKFNSLTSIEEKVSKIKIFVIAPEDNGRSGKKVGCGDSVIGIERQIAPTQTPLQAALQELLSIRSRYIGESGLYSALADSNLKVESVEIKNGQAIIYLTGTYVLGGVCDDPRFEAQLKETAMQFSTVKSVKIYINKKPLEDILSEKGN